MEQLEHASPIVDLVNALLGPLGIHVPNYLVFCALITLIGCYNGLSTEGGTEGLGRATTATVVHVTMGVIVSDFFLTKLLLMLFW